MTGRPLPLGRMYRGCPVVAASKRSSARSWKGGSEGALKMAQAQQEAIGLLQQLARDFNVRDPRKLYCYTRSPGGSFRTDRT